MSDVPFLPAVATDDVPFAQAVATKANVPLEVVETALGTAGVPTTDEAAVPHRLRVTRVRFDGTKAGVRTGPFCFDRTFGPGLWAICSDKNDAGKTSTLEIIMWALRGRSHRPGLPPDVKEWLSSVLVEATLDEVPFSVGWKLTDKVPFGTLTCGDEVTPFSNDEAFENVMSEFLLSRLGFFEFTTGGSNQAVAHHRWASSSAALYLSRAGLDVVLGDIGTAGLAQRLLLIFAGVRWGQTHIACQTAFNEEGAKAKDEAVATSHVRRATTGALDARRKELEEVRARLAALPAALPPDAEIAAARQRWTKAIDDHGAAESELALAKRDAESSRRAFTMQQKRMQDEGEALAAQQVFRSLRPVACPRCSAAIGDDRRQAEATDHTCSVCDRSLMADATVIEGVVSEEDADEPRDAAAFADLTSQLKQAADDDAARVKELAERVGILDGRRQAAADVVAGYRQDAGALDLRRELEVRLATVTAIIESLEALSGGSEPSSPAGGSDRQLLSIFKAATAEAKARRDEGFAQVFEDANGAILELGRKFGFESLQYVKLDASARMKVTKGDQPGTFSDCSPGEKLRLRLALVIALLRVANKLGVGRHPGFLLIDSIGAEETEPGDLATFVRELAAVADELNIEIIVASARPEILTHIDKDHQVVVTGEALLW